MKVKSETIFFEKNSIKKRRAPKVRLIYVR